MYKILHIPTASYLCDHKEYPNQGLYIDYTGEPIGSPRELPVLTTSNNLDIFLSNLYKVQYDDYILHHPFGFNNRKLSIECIFDSPYSIEFQEVNRIGLVKAYRLNSKHIIESRQPLPIASRNQSALHKVLYDIYRKDLLRSSLQIRFVEYLISPNQIEDTDQFLKADYFKLDDVMKMDQRYIGPCHDYQYFLD